LEAVGLRPRQVRYQAALRPDFNGLFDSRLRPFLHRSLLTGLRLSCYPVEFFSFRRGALSQSAKTPEIGPRPVDLIYGLADRPPLRQTILVAMQHVLAVFVGIITPPLIISRLLKLSSGDGALLVSMALFISGIGTLIQTRRWGPVGSGLLSIQGTSFVFLAPIISLAGSAMAGGASQRDALGIVFGLCLVTALVPFLISPFLQLCGRTITPLVTGTVVTLIGLTLIEVGITSVGGGFEAKLTGSFGSMQNLGLASVLFGK
jgi:xanthine permease XanP